jgi:hypothetical protein
MKMIIISYIWLLLLNILACTPKTIIIDANSDSNTLDIFDGSGTFPDPIQPTPPNESVDSVDNCRLNFTYLNTGEEWDCILDNAYHRMYYPIVPGSEDKRLFLTFLGHKEAEPEIQCILALSFPLLEENESQIPQTWTYNTGQCSNPRKVISQSCKNTWPQIYSGEGSPDDVTYYPRPPGYDPRNKSLEGQVILEDGTMFDSLLIRVYFDVIVEDHESNRYKITGHIREE